MSDLSYLRERGYLPAGGYVSAAGDFYLNIPKNASTFLSNVFRENGWHHYSLTDYHKREVKRCIVVMRDPIERWISGFATYASSWLLGEGYGSDHFVEDYNALTERIIFDTVVFDDHTTPQTAFINQLSEQPEVVFFKLNDRLINQLSQFTAQELVVGQVDNNDSENNYDQRQISKFIRQRVDNDPSLKAKIIKAYQDDFLLLNGVRFYYEPR